MIEKRNSNFLILYNFWSMTFGKIIWLIGPFKNTLANPVCTFNYGNL